MTETDEPGSATARTARRRRDVLLLQRPPADDARAVRRLRAGLRAQLHRRRLHGAARTGRLRRGPAEQGQGARQRTRLGRAGRPLLRPRPDAARLRGAPPAPDDDAAGLHPASAGELHRGDGPGRGRRPRLLAALPLVPGLPGPEVADPRPGHAGVHGRCGAGLARRARAGEPRLRRVRAGRGRDHPASAPGHALGPGDEGPPPARGVPRPARRGQAGRWGRGPVLGAVLPPRRRRGGALGPRHRQPHDLPADGGPRHVDHHGHHDHAAARGASRSGEPSCATRPRTSRTSRRSTSSTHWSPSTWS